MADTADSADRLTADALHVAISLDSFTTLDWAERIAPAVGQGNQALSELQRRRAALKVRRCDEAMIDWILEVIDTRLKFLQSLLAGNRDSWPASLSAPRTALEGKPIPH